MTGLACKKLIENFQVLNDKKSENMLLETFYSSACKYAQKFLNSSNYSNMLSYERSEIDSYVYLAFAKAIKTYKYKEENMLSFKNYLYQMIRYESMSEMRNNFNWQVIPAYQKQCKNFWDEVDAESNDNKTLKKIEVKIKVDSIFKFLNSKKKLYGEIWNLKSSGYDNRDICIKLNLSPETIKSKWQYIKKLILNEYPNKNFLT